MQKSELSVCVQDGTIVVELPMGFVGGFGPEGFCWICFGFVAVMSKLVSTLHLAKDDLRLMISCLHISSAEIT